MRISHNKMKKIPIINIAVLLILLIFFRMIWNKPQPAQEATNKINISQEPIQIPYSTNTPLLQIGDFQVYPIAKYTVSGKVLSVVVTGKYSDIKTPGKSIYPIDVGLIWGDVAEVDYEQFISSKHKTQTSYSFIKGNQTLWIGWKKELPNGWSKKYVLNHIGNNHICPATKNIYNAIKSLRKNQKILMQGYLVRTLWANYNFSKKSSLSRKDSDCEDFYVKKIIIENKVYE